MDNYRSQAEYVSSIGTKFVLMYYNSLGGNEYKRLAKYYKPGAEIFRLVENNPVTFGGVRNTCIRPIAF